ncbi:hypothetical protein AMTRI_Chr07g24070 [Amborella trichopoda]
MIPREQYVSGLFGSVGTFHDIQWGSRLKILEEQKSLKFCNLIVSFYDTSYAKISFSRFSLRSLEKQVGFLRGCYSGNIVLYLRRRQKLEKIGIDRKRELECLIDQFIDSVEQSLVGFCSGLN